MEKRVTTWLFEVIQLVINILNSRSLFFPRIFPTTVVMFSSWRGLHNKSLTQANVICKWRKQIVGEDDSTQKLFWHLAAFHGTTVLSGQGSPHYRGFTITLRHTTLRRTPLVEWLARRKDLYLTTNNNHKRQTSMPPARFEPKIPANDRQQTHALDRAATGIGN